MTTEIPKGSWADSILKLSEIQSTINNARGSSATQGKSENTVALRQATGLADNLMKVLVTLSAGELSDYQPELGQPEAQPIPLDPIELLAAQRLLAAAEVTPSEGDLIEFMDDCFTDKGPCSGTITNAFVTVDGLYIRTEISDGQETFSWDDLQDSAVKTKSAEGKTLWQIN